MALDYTSKFKLQGYQPHPVVALLLGGPLHGERHALAPHQTEVQHASYTPTNWLDSAAYGQKLHYLSYRPSPIHAPELVLVCDDPTALPHLGSTEDEYGLALTEWLWATDHDGTQVKRWLGAQKWLKPYWEDLVKAKLKGVPQADYILGGPWEQWDLGYLKSRLHKHLQHQKQKLAHEAATKQGPSSGWQADAHLDLLDQFLHPVTHGGKTPQFPEELAHQHLSTQHHKLAWLDDLGLAADSPEWLQLEALAAAVPTGYEPMPYTEPTYPTPKPFAGKVKKVPWAPGKSTASDGTVVVASLSEVLPGLDAHVGKRCPGGCPFTLGRVRDAIVHLNDEHRWPREKVADWLESLDIDLTFRDPAEVAAEKAAGQQLQLSQIKHVFTSLANGAPAPEGFVVSNLVTQLLELGYLITSDGGGTWAKNDHTGDEFELSIPMLKVGEVDQLKLTPEQDAKIQALLHDQINAYMDDDVWAESSSLTVDDLHEAWQKLADADLVGHPDPQIEQFWAGWVLSDDVPPGKIHLISDDEALTAYSPGQEMVDAATHSTEGFDVSQWTGEVTGTMHVESAALEAYLQSIIAPKDKPITITNIS